MAFDPSRPVQTRDGRPARIVCRDVKSDRHTLLALVVTGSGLEHPYTYLRDGRFTESGTGVMDLINIPEERSLWVNVYPNAEHDNAYHERKNADTYANSDRLDCIEVKYKVPHA